MNRVTRSCKQNTNSNNDKSNNYKIKNQKELNLTEIEYKRVTRNSKGKQPTHDEKCGLCNYKTMNKKDILSKSKGISKHVRIATRKMKTAIANHIAQTSPIAQNKVGKKRAESSQEKESPIKIMTRETTVLLAASQASNTSDHATSPSLDKSAGKTARKLKRTGNKKSKKRINKHQMKKIFDLLKVGAVEQQAHNLPNVTTLENTPEQIPPIEYTQIPTPMLQQQESASELHPHQTPPLEPTSTLEPLPLESTSPLEPPPLQSTSTLEPPPLESTSTLELLPLKSTSPLEPPPLQSTSPLELLPLKSTSPLEPPLLQSTSPLELLPLKSTSPLEPPLLQSTSPLELLPLKSTSPLEPPPLQPTSLLELLPLESTSPLEPPPLQSTSTLESPPLELTSTLELPTLQSTSTLEPPPLESTSTLEPPTLESISTLEPPPLESTSTLESPPLESTSTLEPPPFESTSTLEPPPFESTSTLEPPPFESTSTLEPPPFESTSTLEPPPFESTSTLEPPPFESTSTLEPPPFESTSTLEPPPFESTSTLEPPPFESTSTLEPPPFESTSTLEPPPFESTSTLEPPPFESTSTLEPPPLESTLEPPPFQSTSTLEPPSFQSTSTLVPPPFEAPPLESTPAIQSTQNNEPESSTSITIEHHQVNLLNQPLVIVVDTNIFILKLFILENLTKSYFNGYMEKPTVLVPWRVINELERIHDEVRNTYIRRLSIYAIAYLYETVPSKRWIQVQSLTDDKDHLFYYEVPDDAMLNCCLQQVRLGLDVILLSDDRNLRNRASIMGICNMSSLEINTKIEIRPINYPQLNDGRYRTYKAKIYNLLSTILRNEMQRTHHLSWVLRINPPWTLVNVCDCILGNWDVFRSVFPRIRDLIEQLRDFVYRLNNRFTLEVAEVTCFKKMCLKLAQKCIIITDYMDLAIETVALLKEPLHVDLETKEMRQEKILHACFNNTYIYFASYCSKLCTRLGIRHYIEDMISHNPTTEELIDYFTNVNRHLLKFVQLLKEALEADCEDVLHYLIILNDLCTHVNPNLTFFNKSEISPVWFMNKCRDSFIRNFKKFQEMTQLLTICSVKIRENAMIGVQYSNDSI